MQEERWRELKSTLSRGTAKHLAREYNQAAPMGACSSLGLLHLKIRGFLLRPAAEATQNDLLV
jgi:hypothetical protein